MGKSGMTLHRHLNGTEGNMADKTYYDALLADVRKFQKENRLDEARSLLRDLQKEPDNGLMGPKTVFGLPRRLHAALLRQAKVEKDTLKRIGYQYTLVPPPEVLAPYGIFDVSGHRALAEANRKPVPKIIHQIWIGPKELPVSIEAWRKHAEDNGCEFRLWREADIDREGITDNPVFADMLRRGDYPGAVDVARYVILERFGGIYLDCDWYPARDDISFHDLLPLQGLTAFAEEVPRDTGRGSVLLANSFIAAPPQHPVFTRMLTAIPAALHDMPRAPAWWATGPLLFTVVARAASICLAGADFVVGSLPDKAPLDDVLAVRAAIDENSSGLLIAWKSW
jgi:mannosyltransferase OCH1-like enzyme